MCFEVTAFEQIILARPKTWILPLTLMQGKVFDFNVDFDCNYISLPLSDFFCNISKPFSYNIS